MTKQAVALGGVAIIMIAAICVKFATRGTVRVAGRMLDDSASDHYTSNKLVAFREAAGEGSQVPANPLPEIPISSTVLLTDEEKREIKAAALACLNHLTAPDWSTYRGLKIRDGTSIQFGPITSNFEAYWLKESAASKPDEARVRRLWDFVHVKPGPKAPRIVQVVGKSLKASVVTVDDPAKHVFDVLRGMYDGLATRALDDAVAAAKPEKGPKRVAVVSALVVTSINEVPTPIAFAMQWRPVEKDWWPLVLYSSHPAYAPMF